MPSSHVLRSLDGIDPVAIGPTFCGSRTTVSSFTFEPVRLWEVGRQWSTSTTVHGSVLAAGEPRALAWLLVAVAT